MLLSERRRSRRPVSVALLATAAVTVGCSGGATTPRSEPGTSSTAPASDSPTEPGATEPDTTEPLVVAVHPSWMPLDLDEETAGRIVSGRLRAWRPTEGVGQAMRVLRRDRLPARVGTGTAVVVPASAVRPVVGVVTVEGVDPLVRPADYPLQVPGPMPPAPTVLRVVGDIMLDRGVADRNPAPAAALGPLRGHLSGADLTVGNLESALSMTGTPQQGNDSFATSPRVLRGLAALGIDAVSLANNHTGDYGTAALLATVGAFAGSQMAGFGAGRDRAAASRAWVARRNGVRFGFVGFNAIGETPQAMPGRPGALSVRMPPRTGPLNGADLRHLTGVVRRLDRRVDVVVVLPHWGTQYTHVAEPVQSLVARRLVTAGADLVVGGHPHWVQGLEAAGDAVVAHSLGNLVFDMDFMEQTMEGITLTATFWDGELKRVELAPYRLDDRFRPRLVTGAAARGILDDVWSHSAGPYALRPGSSGPGSSGPGSSGPGSSGPGSSG